MIIVAHEMNLRKEMCNYMDLNVHYWNSNLKKKRRNKIEKEVKVFCCCYLKVAIERGSSSLSGHGLVVQLR